jgi:hypothetical protein
VTSAAVLITRKERWDIEKDAKENRGDFKLEVRGVVRAGMRKVRIPRLEHEREARAELKEKRTFREQYAPEDSI